MTGAARERISLDLRGLGPAIRAHAKARGTRVSTVARLAVVKMLGEAGTAWEPLAGTDLAVAVGPAAKVTVRMPKAVAEELAARSRAAGLSYGAYLGSLISGAPMLQGGVDRKHVVTALVASTDQLALVAADLGELARLARQGVLLSSEHVDGVVIELSREVRTHLSLAARLIADLQPVATSRRASRQAMESSASPS